MSNPKDTSGPAPTFFTDKHAASMTLRDYFAAKAMQAELTNYAGINWERVAKSAYEMADAMLKVREE
jgi:predicted GTPase